MPPSSHPVFLVVLLALLSIPFVHARPNFPDRLPNGRASRDPASGLTCLFLGHNNCVPGAPRNQFGLDFAAANRLWTKELCEKDSDGDGLTNGQELGDPCCTWTPTTAGRATLCRTQLSHPGDASSTNSAPTTCPAMMPTPSTSPSTPAGPVPSTCGEAFALLANMAQQLRCQNVARLKSDARVSVIVSVRNGKFYLSAKVKKRSRKTVKITGYAFAADTRVARIAAATLSPMMLGKATAKLKRFVDEPINGMDVPSGKRVCCGKGTAAVAVRLVLSVQGPTTTTTAEAVLEKQVKVRCKAICKAGQMGSPVTMGMDQRCPACK